MIDDGRKMIYPMTTAQCLKHFPFKFHWDHMPRFKYFFFSLAICLPIFYAAQKASYAPANVKKYEEYLRKEREELEKHMHHIGGF